MLRIVALAFLCPIAAIPFALAQQPPQLPPGSLRLEREIPLPGVNGRIDHLAADVAGQRVFVAAHDNGSLEIVDLAQGKRTAEIKDLKEPQGVAYVPSSGAVYVAGGGDGAVRSFDSHTLKPLHDVTLGSDADNLRYDAAHQQLLAGYGSGAIAVLGLDLARRSSFAPIDLASQAVNAAWTHPGAAANFPMALDAAIHRLFIPCRQPARLLVVDSDTGRITAWAPTVGDADDVFVNEALRLVYVIGGQGYVDVVFVRAADAMVSRARIPTAPGARTGLYVPEWNKLLVAAPRQGTSDARLLVFAVEQ
jgi:hypothetical protein